MNLTYGGVSYAFVANYFGGTGNDLVLQWANTRLLAWGYNNYGQLGNNSTTNSSIAVPVDMTGALAGKTIMSLASGSYHNLALCSDGTLAAWGTNSYGQLGNNGNTRPQCRLAWTKQACSPTGPDCGRRRIQPQSGALCGRNPGRVGQQQLRPVGQQQHGQSNVPDG